ncbi:MAG: Gfo/Idh/MocA family protein [Opitutales bacterium]
MKVKIGLYGTMGHQIHNDLKDHPQAEVVGLCAFDPKDIPDHLKSVSIYPDLEAMLAVDEIQLISFCSPQKDEQGLQIIAALKAGKHVYAEKPSCMSEVVLDEIIETSRLTGMRFHEMNACLFAEPYPTIRRVVQDGRIGEVIQVFSQKSYPWVDWRPADERIDGGLTCQVGIYSLRFAEQIAGLKVNSLDIRETTLGNDHLSSHCRRAVSMMMTFENGAVGSAVANYSCPEPPSWNKWGYDTLRIFGTEGFVETIDSGRINTIATRGEAPESFRVPSKSQDPLDIFIQEIITGEDAFPLSLEEELSPLRWVLRAKFGATAAPVCEA